MNMRFAGSLDLLDMRSCGLQSLQARPCVRVGERFFLASVYFKSMQTFRIDPTHLHDGLEAAARVGLRRGQLRPSSHSE